MAKRKNLMAGAAATTATTTPGADKMAVVATTSPSEPEGQRGGEHLRDQPFTLTHWSATLPEQDITEDEASGPLSSEEQEQLAECHRAIDNARTAVWLLGRALEIVRRRRLHRGDGTRTWEQYLADEHDGMSERDARRLMEEWRLAKAVQEKVGKPAPASHVRAMRAYADSTSDDQAADDYAQLKRAFEAGQVRLAAHQITARVTKAVDAAAAQSDPQQRRHAIAERWQEVHPPRLAIPAPKQPSDKQPVLQKMEGPDPVVGAVIAAEHALERLNRALLDEGATLCRAAVDAEHLQNRVRKVGRIFAKATVPADDVVEGEIVEDEDTRG